MSSQPSVAKPSPSPATERVSQEAKESATSVFICWSGVRSHKIAKAIANLLTDMGVNGVFVSDNIKKGAAWFDSIQENLQGAQVGIVCLTSENLLSPWIHFEAGALARGLSPAPDDTARSADGAGRQSGIAADEKNTSSDGERKQTSQARSRHRRRLFTVLHGVTAAEINGPLSAYQATGTTRREIDQLIEEINDILGNTNENKNSRDLDQTTKQSTLKGDPTHNGQGCMSIPDAKWKNFKNELREATVPVSKLISDLGQTFQRKTFNEPLHQCADRAWLARYEGARLTREKLLPHRDQVKAACPPHESELFELLLKDLDGYAMALQSLLLKPEWFELGSSGELEMDEGIKTCCEGRRLAIRSMAARLLHPLDDPLTDDAVRFMAAETNEERRMIVHRLEARLRQAWEEATEDASKEPQRQNAITNIVCEKLVAGMLERPIKRSDSEDDEEETNQQCTLGGSAFVDEQGVSSTQKPLRLVQLRESSWDLDRIYYYLLVRYFGNVALRWESSQPRSTMADVTAQQTASTVNPFATDADDTAKAESYDLPCAARDIEMEVERYRARSKGGSLMPLTYGLEALKKLCSSRAERTAVEQGAIQSAFTIVREELGEAVLKSEPGRQIERLLAEIG